MGPKALSPPASPTNTGKMEFPFSIDGTASAVRDASGHSYTMTAVLPEKGPRAEPVLRPGAVVLLEFRLRRVPKDAETLILTLVGTTIPADRVRFAPLTVTVR